MPGIDDRREAAAPLHQGPARPGNPSGSSDLESLVADVAFDGRLAELIAYACEKALEYEPPAHADPGRAPHPGVEAAIRAFDSWKRSEGQAMATDTQHRPDQDESPVEGPEVLPLSLLGKWVAWSSDGSRILASAETSEEAERLASEAGEPEPILHRPMAMR